MRRFSNKVFLTKTAPSALKYFTSTILVTLLSLEPAATFAQTDPFAETKSPTANPFADVPTSDTNSHFQNKSETPSTAPASDNAAPASASDQKDNSVATGAPTTTSEGVLTADSLLPNVDNFEAFDPHEPETKQPAALPKPSADLSDALPPKSSKPQSEGWLGWITDNLYLSLAILLLPLLLILGWAFTRRPKQPDVRPRIKGGSFKKSNRFQEGDNGNKISESEGIISENVSSDTSGAEIDVNQSSDMFDFDELSDGGLTESDAPSIPDAATALTGDTASIDDEDDFLDLMMDDSEEIGSAKLVGGADELGVSALQDSGAEVVQSVSSDLSDDDDDFLDLMMDDSEETDSTKLVDSADELGDAALQDSGAEVVQSVASESSDEDDDFLDLVMDDSEEIDSTELVDSADELGDSALQDSGAEVVQSVASESSDEDDDEFFDMMLDDDQDSPQAVEEVAPLAQSTESNDIDAAIEEQDPLALDDDSDEFTFDFEDDTSIETADVGLVEEDLTEKAEEIIASDVDDLSPLSDGVNEDALADLADDSDLEDVDVEEDQSLVAGGVAAAAGALAGVGALLGARSSSDTDQPNVDAASEELREQLAQALQKQQQSAAKIVEQEAELKTLNAKLDSVNASSEANEKLQQDADELKGKLEASEKSAAEIESKLGASEKSAAEFESKLGELEENAAELESKLREAESNVDALEKEKQEIETQLEKQSEDSEEIKKLEAELSELKSQANETATANEQLQSEAEDLRKEVSELKASNKQETADSGMLSASLAEDSVASGVSADSGQFQQLKAKYDEELALRKDTETMLLEAEQQRTDVAIALRDLRKQIKAQGDSGGSSEELDALKTQLADSESANENLEQQLDSLREKLEQEHSVAKELTGKLNLSQEKVSAATVIEDEWKQKLGKLESEVEAKTEETNRLTADLQAAKESLGEIEETVAELQSKEDSHKEIVAKHEATLLESQSSLEAAIAAKSEMEVSLYDLKEKAGALSYGQLEEALASVAKLSEQRSALDLKLEQTRTTSEEAGRENAQLSERVAQLEKQLDANSEIADQLADARKQLDQEKSRALDTEKENNALQLQVDSLKQNFESLDRQRLSLKENLEARDKEAADGEAAINKENVRLTQKIAALENSLSNSDGTGDIKLQLTEGKEQLRYAQEQNSILAERVSGLEQQLKSRHAESEKLDSVQQQLVSQVELVAGVKEENATLKERVGQLNEQINVARDQSAKLEKTVVELSQEKDRLSQMSQSNAANQQRIKLLEDQIAEGKNVSLRLNETMDKLAKTSSERVALNQQVGFLQRDLEASKKSNQALRQKLESGTSADESGSVDSEKLERILGQLQSQNLQIGRLVDENKNLAEKLASRNTTSSRKSSSSKTTRQTKGKGDGRDDLTEIVGIGPLYKKKLYRAGVTTYRQIAGWTKEDVEKYSKKLGFKSGKRIQQEKWVSQAKKLS